MAVRLEILDQYARQVGTINGATISGPLRAYKGLRYIPRGAVIDAGESCSFSLPMGLRANFPLVPGTSVRVVDSRFVNPMGYYYVDEKSETVSDDGHWAQFTLGGLVEELRWETVPGFIALDGETTQATINRLLAIPTDTPWSSQWVNGADQFTGVSFVAEDVTVQQAVDKLIRDRLFHWRRGTERVILYGSFKRKTGIRLVRPSQRSAAMNQRGVRPIPPGGLRNVADAAALANCLVPKGAGDGWLQLTLQPLYNAASEANLGNGWYRSGPFAWPAGVHGQGVIDPNYQIHRRRRFDGGGLDGWQYFITDATSVNAYRKRWLPFQRDDIGPIDNANPTDMFEAAVWLYGVAVAYMKQYAVLHNAIEVTAAGFGDNRDTAGDTVRVEYPVVSRGVRTLNIDGDWIVISVESSVDDETGAITDVWTLSDIGRAIMNDAAVITGILEDIQQIKTGPMVYPVEREFHRDQPINPANPCNIVVQLHAGVQQIVQATLNIQLFPVYSTAIGGVVENHTHDVTIPGQTIDAGVPYTVESPYNPGNQFLHGQTGDTVQGSGYQPTTPSTSLSHGNHTTGTSTNTDVTVNGNTITDIESGIRNHNHTILIVGGGTPSSLGDNVVYVRDGGVGGAGGSAHFQVSNNFQRQIPTDYPGTWTWNGNHNHTGSRSSGASSSTGSGGPGNAQVSQSYGGFTPSVGSGGTGWTPDSRFPGHVNVITQSQTVQTSTAKQPTFAPTYGIYTDPTGKPSACNLAIDGQLVLVGFSTNQTNVDIAPYLKGKTAPVTIVVSSATLGRIVVDGWIRASVSTYKTG